MFIKGEKPLALKILGLKINARVTFRVIAVSCTPCIKCPDDDDVQGEHGRGELPQHALLPVRPGHRGGDRQPRLLQLQPQQVCHGQCQGDHLLILVIQRQE